MTPEDFNRWLMLMRKQGRIVSDADAARALGVTPHSIVTMKREGVPGRLGRRTALACAALLLDLAPFSQASRKTLA